MNDPEIPNSPAPSPVSDAQTITEMRDAIESLRGVFQVVALSGIVLSATLFMYFYKEVSVIERQSKELMGYINDFDKNLGPKIESARTNLPAFAKTNPTIEPIIKKYFATNNPPPPPAASKP